MQFGLKLTEGFTIVSTFAVNVTPLRFDRPQKGIAVKLTEVYSQELFDFEGLLEVNYYYFTGLGFRWWVYRLRANQVESSSTSDEWTKIGCTGHGSTQNNFVLRNLLFFIALK